MRMSLQQMVAGAISEADRRTKLAAAGEEVCPECKNAKAECKCPPKKTEEKEKESAGVKCASIDTTTVEKVASALDFITNNMDRVDWEKLAVGKPMPAQPGQGIVAPTGGPAAGAGSVLQTNMDGATPGMQAEQTGQASTGQLPMTPPKDDVGNKDGQTNKDTALQTDMAHVPGGTGEQPQLHQEGNLAVMKKASVQRVRDILQMRKIAADAENKAQISAGAEPLVNPDGTAAEEGVPKLPGPAQAQANLVQTKDPTKPADITKQQAKAEPKRQMGEVITEPAQRKSTDPVLHNNLDAAAGAGVKLSSVQSKAARAFLEKIAMKGESPDATPEEKEKAEKLKAELKKKGEGKGKEKDSQMPTTPTAAPPAASGGGLAGM